MLKLFMILVLIISISVIYLEIKNRERSDKIFYTFYMLIIGIIILPLLGIFDSIIAYWIFVLLYSALIYWIYTDFEIITRLNEIFLVWKKVDKKELLKIDYEFLKLIKNYFKDVIKSYHIDIYPKIEKTVDKILILAGLVSIGILIYQLIYNNVL